MKHLSLDRSIRATVAGLALVAVMTSLSGRATAAVTTTADFAWLAGTWEGKIAAGPAGGVAEVTFEKPAAGHVGGVMRLIDQGKVIVIELISLIDTPAGVEMRFRHFSTTLEAYEPEFKQNMRLVSASNGDFRFENLTPYDKALSSTEPRVTHFIRRSDTEFVGHSDIIGDDGKPATVEVTYRRVGAAVPK